MRYGSVCSEIELDDKALESAAEAIRELQSWEAFQSAHKKIEGDWALVAAIHAVRAYLAASAHRIQSVELIEGEENG